MMQLTKNFKIQEFSCKDANKTPVPRQYWKNVNRLAKNLQALRDAVGQPVVITSGYRTPEYNKAIGGAKHSQHLLCLAADIKVPGLLPLEVAAMIENLIADGKIDQGGVGIYTTWVHYDCRTNFDPDNPPRWDER